jgi:hypothetical protein
VLTRLYANGVTLRPNHYIKQIGDRTVTLFNIFSNEELEIEDVSAVLLVGSKRPNNDLVEALRGKLAELHVIGDAATPRSLFEAGYEGHAVARRL